MEAQGMLVDVIAGAAMTRRGIIAAAENALNKQDVFSAHNALLKWASPCVRREKPFFEF